MHDLWVASPASYPHERPLLHPLCTPLGVQACTPSHTFAVSQIVVKSHASPTRTLVLSIAGHGEQGHDCRAQLTDGLRDVGC